MTCFSVFFFLAASFSHAAVSIPDSAVSVFPTYDTSQKSASAIGGVVEIVGAPAKKIFQFLVKNGAQIKTGTPPFRGNPIPRSISTKNTFCRVPGLSYDLEEYLCLFYFDKRGDFISEINGTLGENIYVNFYQDEVRAQVGSKTVAVEFSGKSAVDLVHLIGYGSNSRDGILPEGEGIVYTHGKEITCVSKEFASDIPRILTRCGFLIRHDGSITYK